MPDDAPVSAFVSRRYWRFLGAACVLLTAALVWLGGSESGFRFLCANLTKITAGRLQIEAPDGRLLGDWRAKTVRWHDASDEVELQQLTVLWSPAELLHGRFAVERIEATSLRVFFAPSTEALRRPDSLQLPLALSIKQLLLGRLMLGKAVNTASTLAEGIDATLDSDGRTYRLERVQARLGQLDLLADATLAAEQPFAFKAQAVLKGRALEHPFLLKLTGSGSLEQLEVDGMVLAGTDENKKSAPAGDLHARLLPFAAQPLASLSLQLGGIDPSLLLAGAPQALLDIDAQLESQAAMSGQPAASGSLRITNRRSGAFDRQLLPIDSLHSQLNWLGERLAFDGLVVALAGGGQLKGQGNFVNRHIEVDLAAQSVNAHALHSRLLESNLAGPLRAQWGSDSQKIELDLRDAHYAVNARASLTPEIVELSHLQLRTGNANLSAQGQLALIGEQRFKVQGHLQNFDPARFLRSKGMVRAVINADLEVNGALTPALELALHFELRDSRIGDQRLAGKGDADLRGGQLRKVDVDLDAAGNHLNAVGAFGKAGDTLRIKLLAPKLEALGWSGMTGDASANIVIGGNITSPNFSAELQANRLHLTTLLDLKSLSLNAQLGAGAQGKLSGLLRCTACGLPDYGIPALALELKVDGLRRMHHLSGVVGLPKKRELRVALDGGFQDAAARNPANLPATLWNGTLSKLRMGNDDSSSVRPILELASTAPLRVGSEYFTFGPAVLEGSIGHLSIDRLTHEQGRWQSAGRLRQFRPQAVLSEFSTLSAELVALSKTNPQALVFGGEWDFSLDSKPATPPVGRAAVWRESGDLQLGAVSLGLSEARVQASVSEGRVTASAQLRGTRLGEISAELTALTARATNGGVSALIDRQAPWQGKLQARVPDLSWLGPLLGEGWQFAGQLNGEMLLTGSAARPQFSGEWRGENLALRALDQGMRLERGSALVEIKPERLLLRRLNFESDFQPLPSVLKLDPNIDAVRLIGTPGRIDASGELSLVGTAASNDARLSIRLDRVGVMQKPDQWATLSGEGEVRVGERVLDVDGKLRIDAGFWSLAEAGRPSLSDDVVIRQAQSDAGKSPVRRALRFNLDAALGRGVHFRGAGVESRLAGQIRIRSDDAGLPRASGSIRTVDGRFDAYGQKLGIERGIINFQGTIDNPGLNILAVRENLQVEAGVEVTGTAQRPIIRLVSTPVVPDAEKLSWLVLGHSPEQQSSGDGSILFAAAQTILGGQDGGVLLQLRRGLGIDEFGVSSGQVGGYSNLPTSRVASSKGFGSSQTLNGQIVSVGKRLSANTLLSYEQSLNTSDSIVKLTANLSRRFTVVGQAGSDSALDFFWNYSFGK